LTSSLVFSRAFPGEAFDFLGSECSGAKRIMQLLIGELRKIVANPDGMFARMPLSAKDLCNPGH
jgi:hypothetical protein